MPLSSSHQPTLHRPLFVADWEQVLFVHFGIEPRALQPLVPFELELFEGSAYVSLVAFTQRRMRLNLGGRIGAILTAPLAEHPFLNLRTYVRCEDSAAIHFIAEWIPNALAAWIGPRIYGLPYRLARVHKEALSGCVRQRGRAFTYRATLTGRGFDVAGSGSLDHFLLERYAALTYRNGISRRFDVEHVPWPQQPARVELIDMSLLDEAVSWWPQAQLVAAHYSRGVRDVSISAARLIGVGGRLYSVAPAQEQSFRGGS